MRIKSAENSFGASREWGPRRLSRIHKRLDRITFSGAWARPPSPRARFPSWAGAGVDVAPFRDRLRCGKRDSAWRSNSHLNKLGAGACVDSGVFSAGKEAVWCVRGAARAHTGLHRREQEQPPPRRHLAAPAHVREQVRVRLLFKWPFRNARFDFLFLWRAEAASKSPAICRNKT